MAPVDLELARGNLKAQLKEEVSDFDLASYLMYPNVFLDYVEMKRKFAAVSLLPTHVFFYGLAIGEETVLSFEGHRQAIVHYLATSEPDEEGMRRVFFELNGQPQTVIVRDNSLSHEVHQNEKADPRRSRPTRRAYAGTGSGRRGISRGTRPAGRYSGSAGGHENAILHPRREKRASSNE